MITQRSEIPNPELEEIQREYEAQRLKAEEVLAGLSAEVAKRLQSAELGVAIKARVKSFESYYFKRLRSANQRKSGGQTPRISDVLGLRIVCPFLEDLNQVEVVLHDSFEVIEVERKGMNHSFDQFGYSSTHVLVAVPRHILESCEREAPVVCEIQLRTILQDAWAEI